MTVKILWFHLKDSKGVVDIEWEPALEGVTAIGGKSGQGKTAALDNIAWLLGGDRYKPEKAQREGAGYPDLDVTLSNGLRVTRKGKRSSLKVIDTNKKLGNQSLLREFIGTFALDAPKFLRLNGKEKAEALLNIIGVGDELRRLDRLHDDLYTEREAHGRVTTQKEKYAAELEFHKDTPVEETSAVALIEEIQAVDKQNAGNDEQRRQLSALKDNVTITADRADVIRLECAEDEHVQQDVITDLERRLATAKSELLVLRDDHRNRNKNAAHVVAEAKSDRDSLQEFVSGIVNLSTDALQEQLTQCEETNARVRANAEKKKANDASLALRCEYVELTDKIENTRAARIALLDNADLPLPGLGILGGELTYNGLPWDSLSTSDGMRVATAIAAAENPECGFVLQDGLETLDIETFAEYCEDMEKKGIQVIGTRVSTGDECSFLVQEGTIKGAE